MLVFLLSLLLLFANQRLVFKPRFTSPSSVSSFFTICPETWDSRRWVFLKYPQIVCFFNNKNFETLFLIINILYGILSSYIKVERLKVSNSTPLRQRLNAKWWIYQKITQFLNFPNFLWFLQWNLKMSDQNNLCNMFYFFSLLLFHK